MAHITDFTADATQLYTKVSATTEPTLLYMLNDGSLADPGLPVDLGSDVWEFTFQGDFSDGVYTAILNPDVDNIGEDEVSIINTLKATQCLLRNVLDKKYNCKLLQEIEASTTLVTSGEAALARDVYNEALLSCATCSGTVVTSLEGISVWYINDDFIVS